MWGVSPRCVAIATVVAAAAHAVWYFAPEALEAWTALPAAPNGYDARTGASFPAGGSAPRPTHRFHSKTRHMDELAARWSWFAPVVSLIDAASSSLLGASLTDFRHLATFGRGGEVGPEAFADEDMGPSGGAEGPRAGSRRLLLLPEFIRGLLGPKQIDLTFTTTWSQTIPGTSMQVRAPAAGRCREGGEAPRDRAVDEACSRAWPPRAVLRDSSREARAALRARCCRGRRRHARPPGHAARHCARRLRPGHARRPVDPAHRCARAGSASAGQGGRASLGSRPPLWTA